MLKILNEIWTNNKLPIEGTCGAFAIVYKKEDKDNASYYKGVTLMDKLYKMYIHILGENYTSK